MDNVDRFKYFPMFQPQLANLEPHTAYVMFVQDGPSHDDPRGVYISQNILPKDSDYQLKILKAWEAAIIESGELPIIDIPARYKVWLEIKENLALFDADAILFIHDQNTQESVCFWTPRLDVVSALEMLRFQIVKLSDGTADPQLPRAV